MKPWRSVKLAMAFFLVVSVGTGCRPSITTTIYAEEWTTPEGAKVSASFHPPDQHGERPPAVLFIHGAGADSNVWAELDGRVRHEGYFTIRLELSGNARREIETDSLLRDISEALQRLAKYDADTSRIALIGEGLGSALALQRAASDPNVQAVVLLSPALKDRSLDTKALVQALGQRPILIIAATDDTASAAAARTLDELAGGFAELRLYPGSAYGGDILASSPQSQGQIAHWLSVVLAPGKP